MPEQSSVVEFHPIGVINTPFTEKTGMPIQPLAGKGIKGSISVYKEFQAGLKDLEGFSHIILLYHLHESDGYKLEVTPFLDSELRGVFATRAPRRPNAIGLSVVRLNSIKDNILEVEDLDILDGTPLLDIKPFVPEFSTKDELKLGWLKEQVHRAPHLLSDDRFK